MATYIILNVIFMVVVLVVLRPKVKLFSRVWWGVLVALVLLTLVFDNIMIAMGLFEYAPNKILGVYIGRAPVEDFFYALLAVIIVPLLWQRFGGKYVE